MHLTIYITPSRTRFFLLPAEADLPPGDFVVRTVDKRELRVSEEALREFEIPKERAHELLKEEMKQSLRQAREAIFNSGEDASAAETPPGAEDLLRDLFAWPTGERPSEENLKTGLRPLLTLLSENLEVAISDDPATQAQAEQKLSALRTALEQRGFKVERPIEELPAKLAAWREAHPLAEEREQVSALLEQLKVLNEK